MVENDRWKSKLTSEMNNWLSHTLMGGNRTLKETLAFFKESFPQLKTRTSVDNLRFFAEKEIPNWVENSGLEDKIEKEISQAKISKKPGEFISEAEREKINSLEKHRMFLCEMWENYTKAKAVGTGTERARFLELASKEMTIIDQAQEKEKGIQSMLSEIKKAENEESAEELRDYIEGYCLPLLIRKSQESSLKELDTLKSRVDLLKGILKSNPDVEEVVKDFLQKIYN